MERINVGCEFDNLAEKVRGLLFPIGHCLLSIRVTWSELELFSIEMNERDVENLLQEAWDFAVGYASAIPPQY